MDQPDDNSLMALPTKKREQVRFCEIVNTCTERREEKRKRIQRTAWILSHVLRKMLCEHVNGLCPAGKLNEQSIIQPWFQFVRTCPYGWATGCNTIILIWKSPLGYMTIAHNYIILYHIQYKKNCEFHVKINHKFISAAIVAMAFIEFKTKNVGSVYIASRSKTNAGATLLLA